MCSRGSPIIQGGVVPTGPIQSLETVQIPVSFKRKFCTPPIVTAAAVLDCASSTNPPANIVSVTVSNITVTGFIINASNLNPDLYYDPAIEYCVSWVAISKNKSCL